MQLVNVKNENNITSIHYQLTFGSISWWELVHIMNVIIEKDFVEKKGKIHEFIVGGVNKTKELQESNYDIDNYKSPNEETGYISIYGYSGIIGKNVRYTIWNQLDRFLIEIENETLIEKEGEHIYDRMADSIELTAMINCTKEKFQKNSTSKEKNKIDSNDITNKMVDIKCFVCNNNFKVKCANIPSNQKTFYYNCPNCNAELKIGNPNYTENLNSESQEKLTDRDKLIKIMKLPSGIRKLSEEEKNKIICETIINVSKLLKEIQCDASEYQLSQRQQRTKDIAINNIKAKDYLEAYYEIADFVDDYGDRHNGKIFEKEKQEINNLLAIIFNNIQQ